MNRINDGQSHDGWHLRSATWDDIDGLHDLASKPPVYRYLFDGVAPARELIARRLAEGIAGAAGTGQGVWLLEGCASRYAGCVELRPYPSPRSSELTYLLDPAHWGRGLAVRMAWTAIAQAFLSHEINSVIAGADLPNTASFAVMRRLGMRLHKAVQYPLGDGAEYVLHRGDPSPMPRPALIPLR